MKTVQVLTALSAAGIVTCAQAQSGFVAPGVPPLPDGYYCTHWTPGSCEAIGSHATDPSFIYYYPSIDPPWVNGGTPSDSTAATDPPQETSSYAAAVPRAIGTPEISGSGAATGISFILAFSAALCGRRERAS